MKKKNFWIKERAKENPINNISEKTKNCFSRIRKMLIGRERKAKKSLYKKMKKLLRVLGITRPKNIFVFKGKPQNLFVKKHLRFPLIIISISAWIWSFFYRVLDWNFNKSEEYFSTSTFKIFLALTLFF